MVTILIHSFNFHYFLLFLYFLATGTDEKAEGKQRNFVSHIKCRKSLDLKEGREYLIWGVRGDLWDQPDG